MQPARRPGCMPCCRHGHAREDFLTGPRLEGTAVCVPRRVSKLAAISALELLVF